MKKVNNSKNLKKMQNIKKVYIKEFKCIKDFEAEPNGRNIMLLGDNGVGKSSFTQFIKIALGDSTHVPADAKGEGYVITDKEGKEWTFKVKMKEGKATVTIVSPDGLSDSRKGSLSNLIGDTDFDINEFVELSKSKAGQKKQVEIFKGFLDKETKEQIENYEASVSVKYNERSEINKTIKNMEGEIAGHPLNHLAEPALKAIKQINTDEVYRELQLINSKNQKIKDVKLRLSERNSEITKIEQEILQRQSLIKSLVSLNEQAVKFIEDNSETPITEFESKMTSATETNKQYEQAQALLKKRIQLSELKEKSGELGVNIDSQRQSIADAIRDMTVPVEGLSFEGDTLTYNGVIVSPDSLSSSEIEELGIRLKIAENPNFGILFIGKAESIGKARMDKILKIAKDKGLQVIGEQVERNGSKLHIELINE